MSRHCERQRKKLNINLLGCVESFAMFPSSESKWKPINFDFDNIEWFIAGILEITYDTLRFCPFSLIFFDIHYNRQKLNVIFWSLAQKSIQNVFINVVTLMHSDDKTEWMERGRTKKRIKQNKQRIKKCHKSLCLPVAGENIFKYKQSSDWFWRNGSKRFKYSSRPFGIFSNAPVSFCMLGNRCGHTGLNLSAMRTPFHGDGARVGLNLEIEKKIN